MALDAATAAVWPAAIDVLALGRVQERLAETEPRQLQLVQLRYFIGLTAPEARRPITVQ